MQSLYFDDFITANPPFINVTVGESTASTFLWTAASHDAVLQLHVIVSIFESFVHFDTTVTSWCDEVVTIRFARLLDSDVDKVEECTMLQQTIKSIARFTPCLRPVCGCSKALGLTPPSTVFSARRQRRWR
jgi:hypothetical protein